MLLVSLIAIIVWARLKTDTMTPKCHDNSVAVILD